MKRFSALLLACILLFGSFAFAEEAEVFSYDFDLEFHLDASVFPFRQRQRMQGYADLLELLEVKGNLAWCPETESTDLRIEVIPKTKPASAVSFRIYGIPYVMRVTSPLFGEEAACFYPSDVMRPALTIRENFGFPLPELLLLDPMTTVSAFRCFVDAWKANTADAAESGTISCQVLEKVAGAWRSLLESNAALNYWITGVTDPLADSGMVKEGLAALPELLLSVSGGQDLTVSTAGDTLRCTNADGFVLWEEQTTEHGFAYAMDVPAEGLQYVPSFSAGKEEADGRISGELKLRWDLAEGIEASEEYPASRLGLNIRAEGIPASLPADASFSGILFQDGYILPAFDFLLQGSTSADGKAELSLSFADRPEAGTVFSCRGTVTPAVREEPLAYVREELVAEHNIFTLDYSVQYEFIDKVKRSLALGLIDFLYELPVSSCQSIMDDLEDYGILQTTLMR